MEKKEILPLEVFLKEYGFDANELTDKEKLSIVKEIISRLNIDKDCEDLRFSKLPQENKTEELTIEYVKKIQNLDMQAINAMRYKNMLLLKLKKDKKLKRKQTFQKILGIKK